MQRHQRILSLCILIGCAIGGILAGVRPGLAVCRSPWVGVAYTSDWGFFQDCDCDDYGCGTMGPPHYMCRKVECTNMPFCQYATGSYSKVCEDTLYPQPAYQDCPCQ